MDNDLLSSSDGDTDELDDIDISDCEAAGVAEVPGAIESANCRVYSTRELYEKMKQARIDVCPPYQRDVVWPKASQSALIDSIFKNKWVPTLLFSQHPAHRDAQGKMVKEKWVCMDGKQRLTSIRLFLDGEIPWFQKPNKAWYYKQSNPPSASRKILKEEYQEAFLGRGLTTALYSKLTELQERDIFRLVQEGKPLTIGEKMQATAGPWGEYFDEMTQKYMVNDVKRPNGWCSRITNLKRGADFKTMTHMILLIRDKLNRHPQPPRFLSSHTLQKEMKELAHSKVPQELKNEVKRLLDLFMDVSLLAPPGTPWMVELTTPKALHEPIMKGRKTLLSPVEMIWIPYLLATHGVRLSAGRLLELVRALKIDIRKKYPREVKNNTQVTQFMLEWIESYDITKLTGCFKGFEKPRPPVGEADDEMDGNATQPLLAREEMEPAFRNANEPPPSRCPKRLGDSTTNPSPAPSISGFKRPRRAGPQPIPATQANQSPSLSATPAPLNSTYSGVSSGLASSTPLHSSLEGRYTGDSHAAVPRPSPLAGPQLSQPVRNGHLGPLNTPQNQGGVRVNSLVPAVPRLVQNYVHTARPAGFQLPSKTMQVYDTSQSHPNLSASINVPLGNVKYHQFAAGELSRPLSAPQHSATSTTPSGPPGTTESLFRMDSSHGS